MADLDVGPGPGPGRPLAGARILELSTGVAGAYCGLLLRQMGAAVTRWDAPLTVDCPADRYDEAVANLNAGKGSVGRADLGSVTGLVDLVIFDSLADDAWDGRWARTSSAARASLGTSVAVVDIGGIRTSCGPGGDLPSSALTVAAFAGMSWAIGAKGQAPLCLPYDIPSYLTGAEAAGAACLALLTQQAGAAAATWDIAESDVVASYVGQISSNFIQYGRPWARDGARASESGGFYPAAMFRCRDGFVSLFCRTNREWANLRAAMGDPGWSRQPGFDDGRVVARVHADEADVHLRAWVSGQTCDEVNASALEFGFPIARVLSVNDAREQAQFAVRGLVGNVESASRIVGPPWAVHSAVAPSSDPLLLAPTPTAPLAGLKVLDLTWVWSGPMVTAALADLGADVIKVEGLARPDPARLRGAAVRGGVAVPGPDLEVSPYFNQMNRGKRSVGIDITTERGAELVRELARTCDVVVENMRPGALERRGLGYESLRVENPGIVMLSMSMMGQTGPLRAVGGYAPVMSGLTGLDSLVGYSRDELIGLYNPALGDPNGAAHGLALLLAALRQRTATGRGAWLDLAQVECLMSILRVPVLLADSSTPVAPPANTHARFPLHQTFRAAGPDSWVSIAARTDAEVAALAAVAGVPGAVGDELGDATAVWCSRLPPDEASRLLTAVGVPAAHVVGAEDVESSAWAAARGLYGVTDHPYLGEQVTYGLTWKRDDRSFLPKAAAPLFGEHTGEVLGSELGVDPDEVAGLIATGVLVMREA